MAESKPVRVLRESKASRALKELLKDNPVLSSILAGEIHRTLLWKYARGQVKPGIEHAVYIERKTDGAVAVAGWAEKRARKRAA